MKFPSNTNASSSWLDPSEARANFRGSWNSARFFVENIFRELRSTRSLWQTANRPTERTRSGQRKRTLRSFFSVHLGLILLWIFTLWWGEKMTFKRTVADCAWARWENRVCATWIVKLRQDVHVADCWSSLQKQIHIMSSSLQIHRSLIPILILDDRGC